MDVLHLWRGFNAVGVIVAVILLLASSHRVWRGMSGRSKLLTMSHILLLIASSIVSVENMLKSEPVTFSIFFNTTAIAWTLYALVIYPEELTQEDE